jgi:hypothetical protein
MATKKSRKSNRRHGRKSSQVGRINYGGLSGWLARFGARNLMIVSIFILLFAGFGSWYAMRSSAYTLQCVNLTYGVGSGGWCVQVIQSMLDHDRANRDIHIPYYLAHDGSYGSLTRTDVVAFQRWDGLVSVDGVVGSRTWRELCYEAKDIPVRDSADYNWAGCQYITGAFNSNR